MTKGVVKVTVELSLSYSLVPGSLGKRKLITLNNFCNVAHLKLFCRSLKYKCIMQEIAIRENGGRGKVKQNKTLPT
jgi:hypothetical protein